MLRTLLIGIVITAGMSALPVPGYAQGSRIFPLETVGDLEELSKLGTADRAEQQGRMAAAQRACDRDAYDDAKDKLNSTIDSEIAIIDRRLREINNSTGDQRVRDQALAVELLFQRERLTKVRALYARERYVPCDPEEPQVAEYVRICDAFGTGYFYIPGTRTCLNLSDDEVDRRSLCDALGLSGLTISSDDNCLQIGGSVTYEFQWGDYRGEDRTDRTGSDASDTGDSLGEAFEAIGDETPLRVGQAPRGIELDGTGGGFQTRSAPGLSPFEFTFDTAYNGGGTVQRGAFSTEVGGTLVVPAYEFDTSYSGFGIRATLSTELSFGGFSSILLSAGLGYESATTEARDSDVAFPEFGIPGVSPTPGTNINSPTDMTSFEFRGERDQLSAHVELGVPVFGGRMMLTDSLPELEYQTGFLGGIRGGSFHQMEWTQALTDTPAFGVNSAAISTYTTNFSGMFTGLYGGLFLREEMALPDTELFLQKSASLSAGFSHYSLSVDDSVEADGLGGLLSVSQTNTFEHSASIPYLALDMSLGVGNANWTAGIKVGASLGGTAAIDYQRLDNGENPSVNLIGELGFSLGADFKARF